MAKLPYLEIVFVIKSAQKKHEMFGWTPANRLPLLFSTIMQKKNFKSCCAINVLLAQNSKFNNPTSPSFKNKIGLWPFFFLGGLRWKKIIPQNQPMHLIAICSSYCWLLIKNQSILKQMRQCAHNRFHLTIPLFMDVFFEAVFLLCQVAIFWLKKVQFSSQKCNEFSGRNLIAIFETQTRKENFQNNKKCYTTSCLMIQKISKAHFSLSFTQPHLFIYWNWYENDPKKREY